VTTDEFHRRHGESFRTNGYAKPPWHIYDQFVRAVHQPGAILEVSCGNGLLLRYVTELSGLPLEPYGLDINRDAIREARERTFPERAECFVHADLREGLPFARTFATILANPLYADPGYYEQVDGKIPRLHFDGSMERLIHTCWDALAPGGQLLLWCYDGHFAEIAPQIDDFRQMLNELNLGLTERPSGPVVFWESGEKGVKSQ
jgi:SAM-dependent methyltransferase